jgi:hypothetical protein
MISLAFLVFSYLDAQAVHELVDRRVHFPRRTFCLNPSPLHRADDLRTMLKLAHTQNHFQMAQFHFIPREPLKPILNMLSERRRHDEMSPCNFHGHSSFQAEYPRPHLCHSAMLVGSEHPDNSGNIE